MKTSKLFGTIIQYRHIKIKLDDGCEGWKAHAPFDRIIVTATSQELIPPKALIEQLAVGGKMIIPMKQENGYENLCLIHKRTKGDGVWTEKLIGVKFVPLIKGEYNG